MTAGSKIDLICQKTLVGSPACFGLLPQQSKYRMNDQGVHSHTFSSESISLLEDPVWPHVMI